MLSDSIRHMETTLSFLGPSLWDKLKSQVNLKEHGKGKKPFSLVPGLQFS